MKKLLSLTLMLVMLLGLCCGVALADDEINVFVTIADKDGKLALAQESVAVKDIDGDGKLTVNDALYCAHEQKFSGGAAAGYLSETSEYGLSLKKLWGIDNGSGYGYYVNNAAAMSLSDEIKAGAYINAFIYTDTTTWSDTYCYFDSVGVVGHTGDSFTLTLSAVGFDADYNTVISPVEGAKILVDGKEVGVTTDKDGKAVFTASNAGKYTISAKSDSVTLVPPVCIAEIEAKADAPKTDTPKTGDTAVIALYAIIATTAFAGVVIISRKAKKNA